VCGVELTAEALEFCNGVAVCRPCRAHPETAHRPELWAVFLCALERQRTTAAGLTFFTPRHGIGCTALELAQLLRPPTRTRASLRAQAANGTA
jgi:hypothetical protein